MILGLVNRPSESFIFDLRGSPRFCLCVENLANDWGVDFKLNLPTFSYSAGSLFRLSVSNLLKSVRSGTMNAICSDYMETCIEPSLFCN